ncbi:MAG: hypothetical protein JNL19_09725 [Burkholderiales bacterium]|nr:hypothetical protein [Burkholderiales bacterium]
MQGKKRRTVRVRKHAIGINEWGVYALAQPENRSADAGAVNTQVELFAEALRRINLLPNGKASGKPTTLPTLLSHAQNMRKFFAFLERDGIAPIHIDNLNRYHLERYFRFLRERQPPLREKSKRNDFATVSRFYRVILNKGEIVRRFRDYFPASAEKATALGNCCVLHQRGEPQKLSHEDVIGRLRAASRQGERVSAIFALALTTGANTREVARFAPRREAERLQRARCVRLTYQTIDDCASRWVVFPPDMPELYEAAKQSIEIASRICCRRTEVLFHGTTIHAVHALVQPALRAAGLSGVSGCQPSAFRDEFLRRYWVAFGHSDPYGNALNDDDRTPVGYALLRLHAHFLALIAGVCPVRCQLTLLRAVAKQVDRTALPVRDRRMALKLIADVNVQSLEDILSRIDELHCYSAGEVLERAAQNLEAGRFDCLDLPRDSFSRIWQNL